MFYKPSIQLLSVTPTADNGIRLHVQLDQQIPHQPSITIVENKKQTWKEFNQLKEEYFGTTNEQLDTNRIQILRAKSIVYHYVIFAHKYDGSGSSGIARSIPGNDFIVSLGGFPVKDPRTDHFVGSPSQQASTLMHELGHNLGLYHGGGDTINCKPNYLSIMSYTRQFNSPILGRPMDYSRSILEPLSEYNLDERIGISESLPIGLTTAIGPGKTIVGMTGSAVNWNRDRDTIDTGVNRDINLISSIDNCSQPSPNQILYGYDDWSNLKYNFNAMTHAVNNIASNRETMNQNETQAGALPNSTSLFLDVDNNITSRVPEGTNHSSEPSPTDELTPDDVRRLNLDLVSSISEEIHNQLANNRSALSSSGKNDSENIQQVRKFYEDALGLPQDSSQSLAFDLTRTNEASILGSVGSGNLDQAIIGLNALLPTMDFSFGGALSDDKIKESSIQKEVTGLINYAIEIFKAQSCTYSDCIVEPKAANSTIEYG